MAAVVPIRELDRLIDPRTLEAMQDFQLGWFWKIFNMLRVAPHFRLPFDSQFWSLAGARTKGFWDNNCSLVLVCYTIQSIAGQTWIWHEGLVRLAEAGSQFGNQPANSPDESGKNTEKRRDSISSLFLLAYKNYPKHLERQASEEQFYKQVKIYAKKQKIPETDYAEFIAQKCSEYAAATKAAGIPKQFIPYMGKWLRRGRWLDDPSEWVVSYESGNGKSKLQRNLDDFAELD